MTPLSVEGASSAAHRLFMERAHAVSRDPVVTEEVGAAVDRIVKHLDGLPLAIEMAAAHTAVVPVTDLAEHLAERLDLLDVPRRSRTARHHTLSSVIEWSEALLDHEGRALFAEMAVFGGTVSVEDVAAVTGRAAPLEALTGLATRSLLVPDSAGPRARFGMLETIRAYAGQRLAACDSTGQMAERHARHVLAAAIQADHDLRTLAEAQRTVGSTN